MTTQTLQKISPTQKILFFDGICAMCNQLVHFVLRHDRKHDVQFATLQGQSAQALLPSSLQSDLKTVVFVDVDGIHTESDAIIRLLTSMGGVLQWARVLRIVPRFIRNAVYRFIAKHRYRWFGTTESCALLTPEQRMRILD